MGGFFFFFNRTQSMPFWGNSNPVFSTGQTNPASSSGAVDTEKNNGKRGRGRPRKTSLVQQNQASTKHDYVPIQVLRAESARNSGARTTRRCNICYERNKATMNALEAQVAAPYSKFCCPACDPNNTICPTCYEEKHGVKLNLADKNKN